MPIFHIEPDEIFFPPVFLAEEDGLLGVGGDLAPARLMAGYRNGIFPWFNEDDPILWYSPDPRMVLYPDGLRITQSMARVLKSGVFRVTFDTDFAAVLRGCASTPRRGQQGTWLSAQMQEAYIALHTLGYAHSVEVWQGHDTDTPLLVGGLYGVALGRYFCGESMFSRVSNASKTGFIALAQRLFAQGFAMIDCQVYTDHLASLGATETPREAFIAALEEAIGDGGKLYLGA